jgi:hypothetical protein
LAAQLAVYSVSYRQRLEMKVFLVAQFVFIFFYGASAANLPGLSQYRGFTITLRHAIFGRNPLGE